MSQAAMVARTWPRAMPGAIGPAVRETQRFCSAVGRIGFCRCAGYACCRSFAGLVGSCRSAGLVGSCSSVGRVGAIVSICFLTRLGRAGPGRAVSFCAASPGEIRSTLLTLDLAVATQILMQLAVRDIGQVT